MRTVVFRHVPGIGHRPYEVTMEFEDDATDEEIQKEYVDWVWEQIGDQFTWYEE